MLWKPAFKSSILTHLACPSYAPVLPHVIELVLILGHPFVDRDNVLAYPVRLPGLNARH